MARRAPPTTGVEVLRAAEACFAEAGLDATKVEDITARAGIAKGAFYTYFASKEDCWRQIIDAFLVRLAQACEVPRGALEGEALAERMDRWLAHDVRLFEFCWENRALLGMVLKGNGGYAYLLDEFAARQAKAGEAVIRELVAEGLYRDDIDISIVSRLLGGAYDRLARELLKETKRPDFEACLRQAQVFMTRGLFTDAARRELDRSVTSTKKSVHRNGTRSSTGAGRARRGT